MQFSSSSSSSHIMKHRPVLLLFPFSVFISFLTILDFAPAKPTLQPVENPLWHARPFSFSCIFSFLPTNCSVGNEFLTSRDLVTDQPSTWNNKKKWPNFITERAMTDPVNDRLMLGFRLQGFFSTNSFTFIFKYRKLVTIAMCQWLSTPFIAFVVPSFCQKTNIKQATHIQIPFSARWNMDVGCSCDLIGEWFVYLFKHHVT